ncbi:MAG TPA: hypothetical protein VGB85_19340 [Nannocystis sp.]
MPRVRLLLSLLLLADCRPAASPAPRCPAAAGPVAGERAGPEQQRRARGLAALDAGRFDLARAEFAAILAVTPDDLVARTLHDASTRALMEAQERAAESFAAATPVVVAEPPWRHTLVREVPVASSTPPQLVALPTSRDAGIDEAEWFRRHGLRLPEYEVPNPMRGLPGNVPPAIAPSFGAHLLVQAIGHPDHTIAIYGPSYSGGRFVAVLDADARRAGFLDFDRYRRAPAAPPASAEQHVIWAEARDGVLYISHGDDERRGDDTAYLSALDVTSGALRWRSDPGVASAATFVIDGGHILSGHGSATGPAHVFVLDRRTGLVVGRARLASAPEYLFVQGDTLLVRSEATAHAFELRRNRAS